MPAFPSVASMTAITVTEQDFRNALTSVRGYFADLLGEDGAKSTAARALGLAFNDLRNQSASFALTEADAGAAFTVSGGVTITLPPAASVGAHFLVVLRGGSGPGNIQPAAGDTVDGSAVATLEPFQVVVLQRSSATSYAMLLVGGANGSGAVISGTGSTGRWTRALDGTQWVRTAGLSLGPNATTAGAGFRSGDVTWTYPAAFVNAEIACAGHTDSRNHWTVFGTPSATSVPFRTYGWASTGGTSLTGFATAIGRWK